MKDVNKFTLGAAQFGMPYSLGSQLKRVSTKEIKKILDYAKIKGIDSIDTAGNYGESEIILGSMDLRGWKITSKLPPIPNNCRNVINWVNDNLYSSLSNLQLESLDSYLVHDADQLFSGFGDDIYRALEDAKKEGLIKKIGISAYSNFEILKILKKYHFEIYQTPLNIVDKTILEKGVAAHLKKLGVEIHVRSIFLQGLLVSKDHQNSSKFSFWRDLWNEYNAWLKKENISSVEACLNFAKSIKQVDKIIIGILNLEQLEMIISHTYRPLKIPDLRPKKIENLIDPRSWKNL